MRIFDSGLMDRSVEVGFVVFLLSIAATFGWVAYLGDNGWMAIPPCMFIVSGAIFGHSVGYRHGLRVADRSLTKVLRMTPEELEAEVADGVD
jgi:hypothetical protein